jgi:hypothetical protein
LPRFLIIGDVDHTDTWVKCLDESGYKEPPVVITRAEELEQKQRQAADGVEWAECARQNGYPSLADPESPVADDFRTTPTVALPSTMTEDALRELLVECPAFDLDKWEVWEETLERDPTALTDEMTPAQPVIGFDTPGHDGLLGAPPSDLDPVLERHLNKLKEILMEQEQAFWQERN